MAPWRREQAHIVGLARAAGRPRGGSAPYLMYPFLTGGEEQPSARFEMMSPEISPSQRDPKLSWIFINAAPVRTVRHAMQSLDGLAQDQGRAHDGRAVARGEVYVPFTITALPAVGCSLISHVPGSVCALQSLGTFHAARSNGSAWKSDHPGRSSAARHSALGRTTKGGGSGRRAGWPAQHGERLRDVHPKLG